MNNNIYKPSSLQPDRLALSKNWMELFPQCQRSIQKTPRQTQPWSLPLLHTCVRPLKVRAAGRPQLVSEQCGITPGTVELSTPYQESNMLQPQVQSTRYRTQGRRWPKTDPGLKFHVSLEAEAAGETLSQGCLAEKRLWSPCMQHSRRMTSPFSSTVSHGKPEEDKGFKIRYPVTNEKQESSQYLAQMAHSQKSLQKQSIYNAKAMQTLLGLESTPEQT